MMIVVVLGTRFVSYHVALYKQHPEIYKIVVWGSPEKT